MAGLIHYQNSDRENQTPVSLASPLPVGQKPGSMTPLGYQQIVGLVAATALTVPAGATIAYVSVSGAAVRWRDDGTAPTASVGMPVGIGAQLSYSGSLSAVQFIQQSATATLDVAYYQ